MASSLNGSFDSRVRYVMGPHGKAVQVQRGWIEEDSSAGMYTHAGGSRRVDFLFNPSAISSTYAMGSAEEGIPLASGLDPRDSTGMYTPLTNQQVNFDLLFDRMFEVAEGDTDGTWRDAKAFLTLVGIEDEQTVATDNTNGLAIGVMQFVPVWIKFGARSPLQYYGVIRTLGITHTLFSPAQIPYRSAISVSAQLLPKSAASSTSSPTFDGASLHADEIRDQNLGIARERLAREKA